MMKDRFVNRLNEGRTACDNYLEAAVKFMESKEKIRVRIEELRKTVQMYQEEYDQITKEIEQLETRQGYLTGKIAKYAEFMSDLQQVYRL